MSFGKILYHCPLCEWAHEEPNIDERINEASLASVFGVGVMQQVAMSNRAQKIERAIEEHLATHTTVEWVRKVSELNAEIKKLRNPAT